MPLWLSVPSTPQVKMLSFILLVANEDPFLCSKRAVMLLFKIINQICKTTEPLLAVTLSVY